MNNTKRMAALGAVTFGLSALVGVAASPTQAAGKVGAPAYVTVVNRCNVVVNARYKHFFGGSTGVTSINPGRSMSNRLVPTGSIVSTSIAGSTPTKWLGHKITTKYKTIRVC